MHTTNKFEKWTNQRESKIKRHYIHMTTFSPRAAPHLLSNRLYGYIRPLMPNNCCLKSLKKFNNNFRSSVYFGVVFILEYGEQWVLSPSCEIVHNRLLCLSNIKFLRSSRVKNLMNFFWPILLRPEMQKSERT